MVRFFFAVAVLLLGGANAFADGAIVYGLVPQFAGGLAGTTRRLDDVAALGATVVWLSPITDAPPGDFGYAVTDLDHVRPSLGTEADLRALIEHAHALGLRVVLDLPINDLSDRHPFYRDVLRHGAASPYWTYFDRDPSGAPTHYFDWTNLINLNFGRRSVRAYVEAASAHWLRDRGFDGFRMDAAWGPRERSPDFWPEWVKDMRAIEPKALLIAEAFARDPYFATVGFDAAYDWTDEPGHWAWQASFDAPDPARRLRAAIARDPGTHVFRFLDNNDTGPRFITRHGEGVTRVAAAMLLTLPGIPGLYMGDEAGAAFDPYRSASPLVWGENPDLRAYYRRLIALRRREPALQGDDITFLSTSDDATALAYRRGSIVVALNFGTSEADVVLGGDALMLDMLGGATVTPSGRGLAMPPMSAQILRPVPAS